MLLTYIHRNGIVFIGEYTEWN